MFKQPISVFMICHQTNYIIRVAHSPPLTPLPSIPRPPAVMT